MRQTRLATVKNGKRFLRGMKYRVLRGILSVSRALSPAHTEFYASLLGAVAGSVPPLRRIVRKNMELALGKENVPRAAVRDYFRYLGRWAAIAPQVYHHGLAKTGAVNWVRFDESIAYVDELISHEKGMVIALPHHIAHEVVLGVCNLRHRVIGLVRESKDARHMEIKRHWYESALGGQILIRPASASKVSNLRACVKAIQSGLPLIITPDLIVKDSEGLPVRIFGRRIHLKAGAVALAMYAKAPLIHMFFEWSDDHVTVRCHKPIEFSEGEVTETRKIEALQQWCDAFEEHLKRFPAGWQFWLDKRWSRVIRSPREE
jgi:lauroyl/myristoyl acyltransferase